MRGVVRLSQSNTVNQVRAVQYLPVVVWDKGKDEWYVVPANTVASFALDKTRGRHGANPFETITLSLSKLSASRVADADIRAAVLNAAAVAGEFPRVRQALEDVERLARAGSVEARELVRRAIEGE